MSEGNSAVSFKNAYIYQSDDNLVLSDVNFDIAKGEFVYLIGKTGSGKSSLLKTLYADLWLEKGNATIAGFDLHTLKRKEVPFLRRKLGVVFQDFQLFTDRNVRENLQFVLDATGWKNKALIQRRIEEVLTQVGLENSLEKYPHQLSGGEQQRVVIARSLLNNPVILLADEPTGNLDPEVSEQIMATFEAINAFGTAVLMATHDFELIRKYPKRTLKCENGSIHENLVSGNTLKSTYNPTQSPFEHVEKKEMKVKVVAEPTDNNEDQDPKKSIENVEIVAPIIPQIENKTTEVVETNIEVVQPVTEGAEIDLVENAPINNEIINQNTDVESTDIEHQLVTIEEEKLLETVEEVELVDVEPIASSESQEITMIDQEDIVLENKADLVETPLPQKDENLPLENLIAIKPVKAKIKKEISKINTSFFDSIS